MFCFFLFQDKRCVFVDEVYVFVDFVDLSEVEKEEVSGMGNLFSSVFMVMFMFIFLQML